MVRQGGLVLAAGAILILFGLLALVFGAGVTALAVLLSGPAAAEWLQPMESAIGIGVAALGLAALVGGVGIWGGRTWGRVLGVLLSGLGLPPQIIRLFDLGFDVGPFLASVLTGYVLTALLFGWRSTADKVVRAAD